MNKTLFVFAALFCILFGVTSLSFADAGHKPYVGSKAFERMKQLAGNWEGSMVMGDKTMKMKASYKLTSADSVLIETFHEGTPHEMVSVWHDNKSKNLTMTHYCAEHNQPRLDMTGMDGNYLKMDLSSDSEIDVANESHIHSASIQFEGDDRMAHVWTSYKGGKVDQEVKITFNRVK